MNRQEIKTLICIGSNCIASDLTSSLKIRFPSPVDNFSSFNIWKSHLLFSGKIKKSLFKEDYEVRPSTEFEKLNYYYFDRVFSFNHSFDIVHNDFENKKYQIRLQRRIKNFKKYCNLAKDADDLWFIYSLDNEDENIDNVFMKQIMDTLPDFCKERLICIGMRAKNQLFQKYFKYYLEFNESEYKWHDKNHAKKIIKRYEEQYGLKFNIPLGEGELND